jgi:hypothetical protein
VGEVVEKIVQHGGISGAFAVVLAFACWKLYRDLMKCKDRRILDGKESEEKYQNAMREINETLKEFDHFMDRFFDWLTRRR